MKRFVAGALACAVSFALAGLAAADESAADFYQGKTIRIVVGFGPGGGFDLYSRLVARHLPDHLPGKPTIIVQNKGGAGSLIAANDLYLIEPKDGTVFGVIGEGLSLQQRLGAEGVHFDARRFNWLGSAVQTSYACAARTSLGLTIQKVAAGYPLIIAAGNRGSSPYDVPAVLNLVLGLKMKLVAGYRDTPNFVQAIERGEADGMCTTVSTFLEPQGRALLKGDKPLGKIFLTIADKLAPAQAASPWLAGVPSAETIAPNPQALHVLRAFDAPAHIHKSFVAPPDVPPDRVALLRQGLAATFADPGFKADAAKASLVASPISGEATAEIVRNILDTPPEIAAILKQVLLPK